MSLFCKSFFFFLFYFLVLAFAGTQAWALCTYQVLFSVLFVAYFFRRKIYFTPAVKSLSFFFAFLVLYTLLQTCFPCTLLDAPRFYPCSVMPLFGLEHASLFVLWWGVFVLSAHLCRNMKETRFFLSALCGICGLVALLHMAWPGGYLKFFSGIKDGVGPFLNRNNGGIFLFLGGFSALALWGSFLTQYRRYALEKRLSDFCAKQGVLLLLAILLCFSAVFSRSRGVLLAFFVSGFFFSVLSALLLLQKTRHKIGAIAGIVLLFLGIFAGGIQSEKSIQAFAGRSSSFSADTRIQLYRAAAKALKDRPLFGFGVGSLPVVLPAYMDKPLNRYVARLHSDGLELWLGVGLAGAVPLLLLGMAVVFLFLKHLFLLPREKAVLMAGSLSGLAGFMCAAMVDFHFYIPACSFFFFILLGLLCGETFWREESRAIPIQTFLLAAVGLVLAVSLYVPISKTIAWQLGRLGEGFKFEQKIAYQQKALSFYPSPRYALALGLSLYNKSMDPQISLAQQKQYRQQAHALAEKYLKKYPKEKELSALFVNTLD